MPAIVFSTVTTPKSYGYLCAECVWIGPIYDIRQRPTAKWLAADDAKSHNTEHHPKETK